MELLVLEQVDFSYEKKEVLRKASACFERGKMYVILGKSGSGKTTLLSLLGGMDEPKSGKILLDGTEINKKNMDDYRAKRVSVIFQNYNLVDYLTAAENVELLAGKGGRGISRKLGLTEEEITRNVLELSGGQQQRVAIARALASERDILLADEPTGNLDGKTALEIAEIMKRMAHEYKKCVIVVTHSLEVAEYADVVFELKQARLNDRYEKSQR